MKMIDVLIKLANGEIKDQTILEIYDPIHKLYTYTFNGKSKAFYSNSKYSKELSDYFEINDKFLNLEVKLIPPKVIPPKEKKYLIKVNIKGFHEDFTYLNYFEEKNQITIYEKDTYGIYKIQFTEKEMQSIKPIHEFLEDMQGKYELIEVEEN